MGGSVGASLEATGTPKQIAEARREQLVFLRRFQGYRDPDMTLHAVLSLEQGLGSTVQHGCQPWAQCRAQRPITPASSCPGRHGIDVTHVSSATPLYRAIVRLTSREWLNALVGRDVLSEKSVKAEVTGLMPSGPRASRRIGTSSEASWRGASGEAENRYLVRGLTGGASGESENRYLI